MRSWQQFLTPVVVLLVVATLGCLMVIPVTWAQAVNPYDGDAAAISAGATLFGTRCSECHGADAKGLAGPDLTLLWQAGVSDARVLEIIRSGVPDTIMPPSTADDRENWAIVAYLKSLSTVPPFASERGNFARGRDVFASECASCHRVAGSGGSLGPALTRIARVRGREALVSAIREPDVLVPSSHKKVTLVMRTGERITGIRRAEDAFSIQILDTDERLRGYLKSEIGQVIHEEGSLMPAFGDDQLSDDELEDLLAYLATLR
jgi:putative heme-binding domain-containing protein